MGGLCPRCLLSLATEEPATLLVGETVSHYRILEPMGCGGMGIVYKAEDKRLGRLVALKFLSDELIVDPEFLARFQLEAKAASNLNNPHICTVFDIGEFEGRPYIVLEYLEGKPLDELALDRCFSEREVAEIGLQILDGLQDAHAKGILHRDIKPGNLFMTTKGEVKILDFGLARSLGTQAAESLTQVSTAATGPVKGTVPYMSPEQIAEEPLDVRSDLFSLGVTLYELACGRNPFSRGSRGATAAAILRDIPAPLSEAVDGFDSGVSGVVSRLVEKRAEDRYSGSSEAREALASALAMRNDPARRGQAGVQAWRRWLLAIVLVLVGALGAIFTIERLWTTETTPALSVAVIPIQNLSGDPDQEYLADALTDALITGLSELDGLRVPSRTSAMRYKNSRQPLRSIARGLGARQIVEGSVQRGGDAVMIRMRLLDGQSEEVLLTREYRGEFRNIIDLQRQVARAVAVEVKRTLTPTDELKLGSAEPVDPEAYEYYLRGMYLLNRRQSFEKAIEYLKQARERAPENALVHAHLAHAFLLWNSYGDHSPSSTLNQIRESADQAMRIDPTLPEALAAQAMVRWNFEWNWEEAERLLKQAEVYGPRYSTALHWHGLLLAGKGDLQGALSLIERARDLEPHSPVINTALGRIYFFMGDSPTALHYFDLALELEEDFLPARLMEGLTYLNAQDYESALEQLQRGLGRNGRTARLFGVIEKLEKGDSKGAALLLQKVETDAASGYVPPFYFAVLHSLMGDREETVRWLRQSALERCEYVCFLGVNPLWEDFREDPRVRELMGMIRPSP